MGKAGNTHGELCKWIVDAIVGASIREIQCPYEETIASLPCQSVRKVALKSRSASSWSWSGQVRVFRILASFETGRAALSRFHTQTSQKQVRTWWLTAVKVRVPKRLYGAIQPR